MKAEAKIIASSARSMETVPDCSIDLVVTSPPYPMIEMWDQVFTRQNRLSRRRLERLLQVFQVRERQNAKSSKG